MAGLSVECSIQACTILRPTFGLLSMIFRLPSLSRTLAVLFLLVAVVPAQRGEGGELTAEQIQAMRGARQKAGKTKELDQADGNNDANWVSMTPEARLAANTRRGSKAHCRFEATCRPPKLLPGQSGVMMITAILHGQAVLTAPLQMIMTPRSTPGTISIGNLEARPALPGTLAKAYVGRPVYENTAVFEVPVTMGNDAKLGAKMAVAVDLQFDIYHGGSGQAVGRFIERVTTDVEVAAHVDPRIAGRSAKQKVEPESVPVAPPEPASNEVTNANPTTLDSNAMGGTAANVPVAVPEPVEVGEPTTSDDLPPTETGDSSMPYVLIAGGGVFMLLIVLLLMRKK